MRIKSFKTEYSYTKSPFNLEATYILIMLIPGCVIIFKYLFRGPDYIFSFFFILSVVFLCVASLGGEVKGSPLKKR